MKINYEELWEPWHLEDDDHFIDYRAPDWPISPELAERFRRARTEMEAVWQEMRNLEPRD